MRTYAGYLFILLAAVCWGLLGPVGRFALESGISPLEIGFWRAALACIFFIGYAARNKMLKLDSARDLGVFVLFGVFSLAIFFVSYQYAVKYGGAALASVLLYTAPAWVAVFSRLFFKNRLTPLVVTAIGVSLLGIAFISFSDGLPGDTGNTIPDTGNATFTMAGVLFGLLAGLLYSTHYVVTKLYLNRYTVYTLYGYGTLFGAIALLPFVEFAPKSPGDWTALAFLGLICTASAYWVYCEGMKRLEPTKAAVLATLEPVIATAAAWLMWDEMFSFAGWIGAALIIIAVLVLVLGSRKDPA